MDRDEPYEYALVVTDFNGERVDFHYRNRETAQYDAQVVVKEQGKRFAEVRRLETGELLFSCSRRSPGDDAIGVVHDNWTPPLLYGST